MTVTEKLDGIKGLTPKGIEFWRARDLMPILGYARWENFFEAIERAIVAFETAEEKASHHFRETTKMVEIGSGTERGIADYFLSRPACYIIAMNGDTSKPEIAEAQKYFAIQTRRMEKLEKLIGDQRRVMLRNRVKDRNAKLSGTAQQAGVRRFGLFHGAGIQAMYRMRLTDLKSQRGIGEREDWLDRQGVEELAANEFRITQTDAKIKRENIKGEDRAIQAHQAVGKEVREAIRRLGNTMPENLPQEPPIKEIEKTDSWHVAETRQGRHLILLPAFSRRFFRDLRSLLRTERIGARLAAHFAAPRPVRRLPLRVLDLARSDSGHHDGGADHIGGALLTLGTSGHHPIALVLRAHNTI